MLCGMSGQNPPPHTTTIIFAVCTESTEYTFEKVGFAFFCPFSSCFFSFFFPIRRDPFFKNAGAVCIVPIYSVFTSRNAFTHFSNRSVSARGASGNNLLVQNSAAGQ